MMKHLEEKRRRTFDVRAWSLVLLAFSAILSPGGLSRALAASPSLGSILPRGGQRGTQTVLYFNGGRLSDTKEILFYYPGITVTKLEVVNDGQVKAAVKIAPDCRLGEHAVRVRTASGISELHTFFVGALPQIDEKEPNSEFTAPQKIPLNVTVNGVIDNEDVDYFSFEAKKGQRVTAEIEAMRLGETLFDPYVAILDMKRFELAASDDAPLLGQDAVASVVIPADGTYVVQVRESAYGGNGACRYRLHVGTFPRPTAVVPAGGKLGEEVEVTFLGDPAGEYKQRFKLPATYQEKFGIFAQDASGISPSPNPFRLSEFGNVIEVEPNDTHAQATPAELPCALNGVISKAGDIDYFRFKAKKGQIFDVHCYARRLGSALDSVMVLSHFNGGGIVGNDDAIGPDSYFRFTAPEDKEYVISVTDHLGKGGPNYFYRIEFTPVKPKVVLSIPKVALFSQERQTIAVPRGNRYAALISGARGDFGGELVIGAEGLPKGVTVHSENMAANLDVVPVLFEAAPDAPVAGTLANIVAHHADPAQKIHSAFSQLVELVTGPPGQSVYWTHTVHQAAVAVIDEVPFKIRIVEPKVPLVHNGSMNLKIVAKRKKGYNEAITIVPLFNPPGVGSASSVTIPAGQNEVLFPINANGGAPVRKWKYVVLGVANVGNGPIWVASQLATLEITPPYVAFAMERAAAEQGRTTELFCKVQQQTPFPSSAKVNLIGLPAKVTAPELQITKETKEFTFKLNIDKTSPAGQHRNLFCQVVIMQNGEPIVHNVGSSELRIDVPLPPKQNEAPKAPAPAVAAKKPEPPKLAAQKRLTRLEQLRLEQEEREKAGREKK
ncbi:MAG TPA: PPC domain-containing protein [Gemmataceae bacterium]|nr:PPC domain-containing protein [Gemmataceae bacterium]